MTLVAAFAASTIAAMSFWTAATLGIAPAIAALVLAIVYLADALVAVVGGDKEGVR